MNHDNTRFVLAPEPLVVEQSGCAALTLTPDEREALAYALDLACDDQEQYLSYGNPAVDYGNEWPAAAAEKSKQFTLLAGITKRLGLSGVRFGALVSQLKDVVM